MSVPNVFVQCLADEYEYLKSLAAGSRAVLAFYKDYKVLTVTSLAAGVASVSCKDREGRRMRYVLNTSELIIRFSLEKLEPGVNDFEILFEPTGR